MADKHDVHDFILRSQREIEEEYIRISSRASEDPGTAGDQGENNWATILKQWLPNYFYIVTKGRILFENGIASPQVDILVLRPSYPKALLDKKLYLAGGVVAAFECKTTLKAKHITDAVKTSVIIRDNLPKRTGTPYKELNSSIIFGILAHSHSWKLEKSKPIENINKVLIDADEKFVTHPIQQLDYIVVSDLGVWHNLKMTYINPKTLSFEDSLKEILSEQYGENGSASSSYVRGVVNGDRQKEYFSPIGAFLAGMYSKLAWQYSDMRELDLYFRNVNMIGAGEGRERLWPITIYSENIRERILSERLVDGNNFSEWRAIFT